MLIRSIAAIVVLGFAAALPAAAADNLQALVQSAMAGSKVPAVGALVIRDGKVAEQATWGVLRNDDKARAEHKDVWLIGSTGKVMTVAMIARLVERGTLAWDTPLEKMLPALAKGMQPAYRKATLLELLSHRAGLPRDVARHALLEKYFTDTAPLPRQRLQYIADALKDKPAAAHGAFSYSNSGFLIAAVIAEQATGDSYETLMKKEVFETLGMSSVGFGDTKPGQTRGHQRGKPMLKMRKFDDGAPAMFAPAGFLHMNLADWAAFNIDQLAGARGQGKLLRESSYRLMQTAQPDSPAGLDWGVQASIAGRQGPALVHQGSDGNWLAIVVLFPAQNSGALVVANAGPGMGAEQVLNPIFGQLFSTLSPAK